MNLLLIEDNDNKARSITTFLEGSYDGVNVTRAKSYQSGVKAVLDNNFDLILLDMTMPTFDVKRNEPGGKPQAFAGKYVLDQIDRYDLPTPVIIVTQFETFGSGKEIINLDQLDLNLKNKYDKNYKGKVYYHAAQTGWELDLKTMVDQVVGCLK